MLSSVELDQPKAYVHSGQGEGVVDSAPLWPTKITVGNEWTRQRDQTVEFWFKQEPNSTTSYCVLSVGANNTNKFMVAVNRSNHASLPGKVVAVLSSRWLNASFNSAGRYDDGKWHHCVIEMTAFAEVLNFYFYFDGQFESSHYRDASFDFGSWGSTTIGDCERFIPGYVIQGSPIDEIALYDYMLSSERIEAHYNEVTAVPPGPSVAIAGQIDISGSVKTNKFVRLSTAQFDVDGFIRALILKDPMPFSIASQIDISGFVKTALAGKLVAMSTRMQSSDIDAIVRTGIGIRL